MTRAIENHWIFGNMSHIEFVNGGEPISKTPSQIQSYYSCASISDLNGNLLFYSDGINLWDSSDTLLYTGLGGNENWLTSVLIVPPPLGGTIYHVFTVSGPLNNTSSTDVIHSSYSIANNSINQITLPTSLLGIEATVRIAAIAKEDCSEYWFVAQELNTSRFHVVTVSDQGAILDHIDNTTIPTQSGWEGGQIKFSPNGNMLAYSDYVSEEVTLLDFNNSTGTLQFRETVSSVFNAWGLEFSANSNNLYFTSTTNTRAIIQYDITTQTQVVIDQGNSQEDIHYAMQLGPNNKIYIVEAGLSTLSVIENPNNNGLSCNFLQVALNSNSNELNFNNSSQSQVNIVGIYGLPSFVRLSDSCLRVSQTSPCETLISDVNEILEEQMLDYENNMEHCDGSSSELVSPGDCDTLELPEVKPTYHITYGDSYCDCIESDDIETMTITICNPYNNISLDNVVISSLVLVDENGDPVATLPNGDPSGEIVPIGPYCFGTIDSCSCISREFSFRSRGMIAGKYKIIAKGICFDVNIHQDDEACFIFEVCKD